jgi:hypothetical protein
MAPLKVKRRLVRRRDWDALRGNDTEIGIERPFDDIVVPAARAVASIVPLLGYGRAHLVLGVAATVNTDEEEWPP